MGALARAGARMLQAVGLGRAIKAIFPELEAGRMARRLSGWTPSRAHVNTLIGASGKTVIARARYLTRNNGYAAGAVECFAANLIGTGIHPSWQVKNETAREAIRELWNTWVDECDAEGVTNFYGLQRRIARELFIAGECFVRFRPRYLRDGLSVPLQLELLPAEQLPIERNLWLENGNRVRQGIEFNQIGQRVAYHFWKVHPGDITQSQNFGKITIVPASEVMHIHDPIESGQIRGLPRMTPAIVSLWLLDAYDDAELERKKTAALFSVFIRRLEQTPSVFDRAAEEAAASSGSDEVVLDLQPGVAHQLKPGEDVTVAQPAEVGNTYDFFQYRNLCRFCAAVGLPYSGVTGDKARANYSNERSALLDMRRRMESLQGHVVGYQLCKPVLTRWLDTAVLAGELDLPDYAAAPLQYQKVEWIAPPWDWVDPLKDRMAEVIGVNAGFKPRSRVVEAEGYDPIENDQQIADDAERAADLDITFAGAPTQATVAKAPPPGSPAAAPPPAAANGNDGGDTVAAMVRLVEAFERIEKATATPTNGLAH